MILLSSAEVYSPFLFKHHFSFSVFEFLEFQIRSGIHFFSAEDQNYMSQSYHPGSSAHRRRTDLMPTITFNSASPASGLSRSSTPGTRMLRSPGKAVSMSRLDALSKPRSAANHSANSKAMHEQNPKLNSNSQSMALHQAKRQLHRVPKSNHSPPRKMSQSMSHLGPRIKPKLEVAKGKSSSGGEGIKIL